MARCHRQHVLKSTPVPPSLQLPWRVHDIQPLSNARCRCLLVDVLSGHASAIKLWHVRKGANNALISLISLSFRYFGSKRSLVGLKRTWSQLAEVGKAVPEAPVPPRTPPIGARHGAPVPAPLVLALESLTPASLTHGALGALFFGAACIGPKTFAD